VGHFREYFRMLMPEDFRWDTGLLCTLKVVWGKLNSMMNLSSSTKNNSWDILFVFTVKAAVK